jgi:hypothetical protein
MFVSMAWIWSCMCCTLLKPRLRFWSLEVAFMLSASFRRSSRCGQDLGGTRAFSMVLRGSFDTSFLFHDCQGCLIKFHDSDS